MKMSIWAKVIAGVVVLGIAAAGLAFGMDVYGVRRGCFAHPPDQADFEAAQDSYIRANAAITSHNYAAASDMLDVALSRLGDAYQLGRADDETVELVSAAKAAAVRSEFQIAAEMKREAMGRRLYLFQRKTRLSGLCHDIAKRWHLT
jgi:hypothetical protein